MLLSNLNSYLIVNSTNFNSYLIIHPTWLLILLNVKTMWLLILPDCCRWATEDVPLDGFSICEAPLRISWATDVSWNLLVPLGVTQTTSWGRPEMQIGCGKYSPHDFLSSDNVLGPPWASEAYLGASWHLLRQTPGAFWGRPGGKNSCRK